MAGTGIDTNNPHSHLWTNGRVSDWENKLHHDAEGVFVILKYQNYSGRVNFKLTLVVDLERTKVVHHNENFLCVTS